MTDTTHLGLPFIEGSQAQKHVTHNEALRILDTLVMLAVNDRDLSAPPSSPADGARYIVKATGTGAFAAKDNQIATYTDGEWWFFPPQTGWTCYVQDEGVLLAWNGTAWAAALDVLGGISDIENLSMLGIGTTADTTNRLSAKLNNTLWTAKTVAEGGTGDLRYKMSKESSAKTLSLLLQDAYSGRAEIGLTGDDDLHFKVSADGSAWTDALLMDRTTGSTKINSGFFLTGDISPTQLTADQNDYNPTGLSGASVLRLSSNASRNVTGLSGGGDGRLVAIVNTGSNAIVLKDASASSSAANRFSFGADVTLAAKQSAVLLYDATDTRWKMLAGPSSASSGGAPADIDILLGEMALQIADNTGAALFLGSAGNRFADSFKALTYVDTAGATNLDSGTAGLLKPTFVSGVISGATGTAFGALTGGGGLSAAFDGTTSQNFASSANLSSNINSLRLGKDWGSGVTKTITRFTVYGPNSTGIFGGGRTVTHYLYGSNTAPTTDTDGTLLYSGTGYTSNANDVQDITSGITTTTAYRYHWIRSTSNVSDYAAIAELLFYSTGATNNVTVASAALTAAAVPVSMKLVARAKFIDSITLGTDLIFEVSRDGGPTWTAATMTDRFTAPSPIASIHVLESAAIDVSAQPSGTSVKWRARSANNKSFELHDVYLTWS